jgi:N-methylhydantoinase A
MVLRREGFGDDAIGLTRAMDLRYGGQQWTIAVATPDADRTRIRRAFEAEHNRLYGYLQPKGRIEIVNLRVTATGVLPPVVAAPAPRTRARPKPVGHRAVWLDPGRGVFDTPVYSGQGLRPGQAIDGPAVIDEETTTILVGAGDRLAVTGGGNYLIRLRVATPEAPAKALAAEQV